jgi:hypothetical protein
VKSSRGKVKVRSKKAKVKRTNTNLRGANIKDFGGGGQCSRCRPYFCLFSFAFLFSFGFLLLAGSTFAQDDPPDSVPPPLKMISKQEKASLEAVTDVKNRTKLELEYMEAHLAKAEKLTSGLDYDAMYLELGGFHALLDNSLQFLTQHDNKSDKFLNNFKKLEIGLREFVPRLETIRRELPQKYEPYVGRLVKYVRDARTKAVEPLFSNSVVPDPPKRP